MERFLEYYLKLIIIQYYNKPKARGEVSLSLSHYSNVYELIQLFYEAFDLDKAVGVQLDIIGKIEGIPRSIPFIIPKKAFGFNDNPNSGTFGDKFNDDIIAYPFADKFTPNYTDYQMDDTTYRKFIKIKISKNTAGACLSSGDKIGIQEAVINAFDGGAYVVDNYDMSLTLYVTQAYVALMRYVLALDLLPRPQGVRYKYVIMNNVGNTFGFSDNPNSKGFADKFNTSITGGKFAEKINIGVA